MEGTPRSFMWNRIKKLESAIKDRPKIAQAGREIAKFFFLKAIAYTCVVQALFNLGLRDLVTLEPLPGLKPFVDLPFTTPK